MSEPNSLLREISASVAYGLQRKLSGRISEAEAAEVGDAVMHHIRAEFGGLAFYLPKGHSFDVSARHWEIYNKFTGDNHKALALEFGLTEIHIYRVVKECQRVQTEKTQGKLL